MHPFTLTEQNERSTVYMPLAPLVPNRTMRPTRFALRPLVSDVAELLGAAFALAGAAVAWASDAFETVAFWSAIALPFLHLPVLLYGAPVYPDSTVVVALLAANVVALVVGHDHRRGEES